MHDDEHEKWRNFVMYKLWMTNKERDELLPRIGLIAIIIFVVAVIIRCFI